MDIKTFAAAAGLAFSVIFSSEAEIYPKYDRITDDLLRLHILADSDSEYDQNIKLAVRDDILRHSEEIFGNCTTREDIEEAARENLGRIKEIADETLSGYGCGYDSRCEIVKMHFDKREYGEYTVPAGEYTALRVTLGSGSGHNWWCVMYPTLCLPCFTEEELSDEIDGDILTEPEKYEAKLYIAELIKKIVK